MYGNPLVFKVYIVYFLFLACKKSVVFPLFVKLKLCHPAQYEYTDL